MAPKPIGLELDELAIAHAAMRRTQDSWLSGSIILTLVPGLKLAYHPQVQQWGQA